MDYTELVKDLRSLAKHGTRYGMAVVSIREAADAIEELQGQIDGWIEQERKALLKSVPKWIPAAEKLPEENDDVLIYGEWTGASGTKYREIWLTDLKEYMHQGYKPIAWMPLPTPPKEETE